MEEWERICLPILLQIFWLRGITATLNGDMPLPYSEICVQRSYEYESHFSRHKLPANLETSLHSPARYLMLCHADLLEHTAMVCRAFLNMGTERSPVLHCLCSETPSNKADTWFLQPVLPWCDQGSESPSRQRQECHFWHSNASMKRLHLAPFGMLLLAASVLPGRVRTSNSFTQPFLIKYPGSAAQH